MDETGWIVAGAYAGNRISQFQWFSKMPACDGIPASREAILDGYIYTVRGDKITVKKGVITIYEKATKGS